MDKFSTLTRKVVQIKNKEEVDASSRRVLAYNEVDKAREATNTFSNKFEYDVNDSTYYIMGISDNHSNLDALVDSLTSASYFGNMGVIILGDQGKVSIPNSKTPSAEAKPLQVEMDTVNYAIEASNINVEEQLLVYLDGNHEDRVKKHSSIELGKATAAAFGIEDRYAGNTALLTLNLRNPLNPEKTVKVTGFLSHGQGRGGGPGAEADKSLNSKFVKGVNFVAQGDTHKIINANKVFEEYNLGGKHPVQKEKMFVNFGTDLSQEDYLLERGIAPRALRDGEILKIQLVPNKKKTDVEVVIDYVNIRQVLNDQLQTALAKFKENKLFYAESADYASLQDVEKTYKVLAATAYEEISKLKATREPKSLRYAKKLQLIPLSGLNVGRKDLENDAKFDEMVQTIAKLDDRACKVILNGDMVYYKKANNLKKINFPEDTFAYLQTLAAKLEPIKSKIIAYNSGVNEAAIMKTTGNDDGHALKLAKIAMKTIQLDKNLAFKPIPAAELKIEKMKIQNQQVEDYNKTVLKNAFKKFNQDLDKLDQLAKFEKESNGDFSPLTKEEIYEAYDWNDSKVEEVLVRYLRKEGKLLDSSSKKDRAKINKKFPLSEIHLEQPHPNLVQNILCKLLDINPKSISINSDLTATCDNHIEITNGNGEKQGINIVTSYKKGAKSRRATEKTFQSRHNGADIFVSNGEEYFTKEREGLVDADGTMHVQDIIHISGGRLDDPNSVNRIYEIRSEIASRKRVASGIFEDTNNLTLTVSSKSYKTMGLNTFIEDAAKMFNKAIQESYSKAFEKTENKLNEQKKAKAQQGIQNIVLKEQKKVDGGK